MEAHIAKGDRRTGQFNIAREKAEVVQVTVRDSGQVFRGKDLPAHSFLDGPSGTMVELASAASDYLILTVADTSEPTAERGSKLKALQAQIAEEQRAAGAESMPARVAEAPPAANDE